MCHSWRTKMMSWFGCSGGVTDLTAEAEPETHFQHTNQWQLPGRLAKIFSRLRASVKLTEHFVHGVDNCLRLVQLDLVP